MNFQEIRKYYETPVIDACNLAGITYQPENTLSPEGDAVSKFCQARLQFGEMSENSITCGLVSNKRAVFTVEFFGPKGVGPADAQNFMSDVMCRLGELKGIVNINGPDFTALDETPYFFARVSLGLVIPNELD